MKLNKLIAATIIATSASAAFALSADEDLTTRYDIVVKNNFGECVQVNRNIVSPECHDVQAPVEQEPVQAPQTQTVMQSDVITLAADTYFDFDKSTLKAEGKQAIQQLASELNQRGAEVKKITIVGHTDSVGSEQYNQGLSERRARSVGDYMLENGVPASLIQAYGQGESQPVATNKTAAGRAQNRRVEITVDGQVTVPVEQVIR